MPRIPLPSRYEAVGRLGQGGGGEVWAVRDKYTGKSFALKVLAARATGREMSALVREAITLSGLEGLGVPRVVSFGRLPGSARPFLVRELVTGVSLDALIQQNAPLRTLLSAIAEAADKLTLLHRAALLHGDIKPANIIVDPSAHATLVDLGLAAPWQDSGTRAEGLTPKFAAPELLEGEPLTVRAEIYALGATLAEALRHGKRSELGRKLQSIVNTATAQDPDLRYPSADEFSAELRRVAQLEAPADGPRPDGLWPIVGIESVSALLLDRVDRLQTGGTLVLDGPAGSGRSTLLRRLAWSLGIAGKPMVFIDEDLVDKPASIEAELSCTDFALAPHVLVDDAEALPASARALLESARNAGARLVCVGTWRTATSDHEFSVPPLEEAHALGLLRRTIPSLTDALARRAVQVSGARPGELRRLVRALSSEALASAEDMARVLDAKSLPARANAPENSLERAFHYLDRGRYTEASAALDAVAPADGREMRLLIAVARARLELGRGEAGRALAALSSVESDFDGTLSTAADKLFRLYTARVRVATSDYAGALLLSESLEAELGPLGVEALAYSGLALSYLERHEQARASLTQSAEGAKALGSARIEAIALAGLGLSLQRIDRLEEARAAYESALDAAERASDAGTLATIQLNVASLSKVMGDIAASIRHFEAAVDMGRRSGRSSTVRQALLNLANTDLYLGRLARAQASIELLGEQRGELPAEMRAQLSGLEAELYALRGEPEQAEQHFKECERAYEALGRGLDMAEACLERVVIASRLPGASLLQLRADLARAEAALGDGAMHRPLALLAASHLALLGGDEARARHCLDESANAARAARQREWLWRALAARAELEEIGGQALLARRDREEALAVLEEIAAMLPRDLREVYWNDRRRRELRSRVQVPAIRPAREDSTQAPSSSGTSVLIAGLDSGATPLERRLARLLEINSELAAEHDLERLTARIVDHAVELLRAERGFLLMLQPDGSLSVHTSRSRVSADLHVDFSRSIAATVIETREPVVSVSAREDARMNDFPSVHEMMLQSVACVPIAARARQPLGALYIETRLRKGAHFEAELGTLQAFADQAAIALGNARLLHENQSRADELASANRALAEAREHLEELLEERTLRLKRTRQKLRETRDTLFGHFGYQGLVGTSAAMRRVYALVDRIKDTDVPVLITGESGTGKEVVARAIHAASPRIKAKFLGVNCGAIPEHLLEAELFGHVRGAYTNADRDRKGLFREAAGGSILLDEIGEMPHKMQAGLLRVLQDRCVRPVGGATEEPVDVRLMFATNRDLAKLVTEKKFREDLYYRIHVVEVPLPPLRARTEDVPQLVDHFLGIFAARYRRERKAVSREAMRRLCGYAWPGNVRQLEHVLLNAWVLSDEAEIEAEDFDLPGASAAPPREARSAHGSSHGRDRSERGSRHGSAHGTPAGKRRRISEHRQDERERILKALQACNWNRLKAAELSGIPRRTFYRRLREYGIQ